MKMHSVLFIITIVISSFLLFQVQPIISKYILPWFGGTSAVWITAMLFFQVILLVGYAYVFFLRRFSLTVQVILHLVVLIGSSALVFFLFPVWQAPILPDRGWVIPHLPPTLQVLHILLVGVGLPYFLLSTTSIVLQKWFGIIREGESPYLFYAFSNAASLLGILSYPFLIEPFLPLQAQGWWWSFGFISYTILLSICCLFVAYSFRKRIKHKKQSTEVTFRVVSKQSFGLWFLLSFTSTVTLLSVTNFLTQSIAPVPFLWLLPLSLYLGSFIICFSSEKWYARKVWAYLFVCTMPWAILFTIVGTPSTLIGAIIYGLVLLSCCMLCHGELYRFRPHPKSLDTFYVVIALGGAVSGIFVGIIAPLLFQWMWEIYIAFYFGFLISVGVLIHSRSRAYQWSRHFFSSQKETYLFALIGFPVILIATSLALYWLKGVDAVRSSRSFYSILTIEEKTLPEGKVSYLKHGNIVHGGQYHAEKLRHLPTTYYTETSAVNKVFSVYPRPKDGLHVGVVGLGVGTIAAFGKAGDVYRFYEIDPKVVEIAQTEFSYLKDSQAKVRVIVGDGRLSLEREVETNEPLFDILILDAFSGDSIPVHLLTKEAFAMYLKRLAPNGVLVIHISNSYLDLKPPLQKLSEYYDLEHLFVFSPAKGESLATEWALFTYDKEFLKKKEIKSLERKDPVRSVGLWTDDYSNLFQILK